MARIRGRVRGKESPLGSRAGAGAPTPVDSWGPAHPCELPVTELLTGDLRGTQKKVLVGLRPPPRRKPKGTQRRRGEPPRRRQGLHGEALLHRRNLLSFFPSLPLSAPSAPSTSRLLIRTLPGAPPLKWSLVAPASTLALNPIPASGPQLDP